MYLRLALNLPRMNVAKDALELLIFLLPLSESWAKKDAHLVNAVPGTDPGTLNARQAPCQPQSPVILASVTSTSEEQVELSLPFSWCGAFLMCFLEVVRTGVCICGAVNSDGPGSSVPWMEVSTGQHPLVLWMALHLRSLEKGT